MIHIHLDTGAHDVDIGEMNQNYIQHHAPSDYPDSLLFYYAVWLDFIPIYLPISTHGLWEWVII